MSFAYRWNHKADFQGSPAKLAARVNKRRRWDPWREKNQETAFVRGRVGESKTGLIFFLHFCLSGINFWRKSRGRVTSKVENLVFYKHEAGVLFVEGFAEKFPFSFQAQSCPRLFRTLPLTLCSIQVRLFFSWSLVCSLDVYSTAGESCF